MLFLISSKLIFFFLCGGGDHGMVGVILRYVGLWCYLCFDHALLLVLFVASVMFYF